MTYFWIGAALLAASGLAFLLPPLWGASRRERAMAAGAAVLFPLLVAAVYFAAGTPAALAPPAASKGGGSPHAVSQDEIQAMVARLAARMRETPQDTDGWIMLARSYGALGRYSDASLAYERALERLPEDSRLLADYADIAAMAQGRRLQGKPEELIRRALAADPQNVKALSLAGTAAFEKGDYAGAAGQWRKILALVPAGAEIERSVRGSIAEAEQRGGKASAASTGSLAVKAIEGRVELSDSMKGRVKPDDTVFIFARVPGERAPLAMLRRRAAELPLSFRLDDSAAMNPAATLSTAKEVVIVARVSRAGTAAPQAGDIEGASKTVRAGASGIVIRIDSETAVRR
jgi:cytochrome c-type biogenesis protein CcmH